MDRQTHDDIEGFLTTALVLIGALIIWLAIA